MKNAILILAALVTATCLPAQNGPPDKSPKPQHMDKRIRVSERILNGMALTRVLPQPPWSKDNGHEEGEVTVGVLVDYDGTVKTTHAMSGDPVLADVAEKAVKQWQFRPFTNGRPLVWLIQRDNYKIGLRFSHRLDDLRVVLQSAKGE